MKVKKLDTEDLPKASNPYEGKPYAGCEGGYCASDDFAVEVKFWRAANKGDVKAVKKLLANKALNITRNIVPDSEGFARVVDVAMWTASSKGHVEVMKVLLAHPGVKDLYKYEDGHTLDLAAMAGHKAMVELLLKENMPVGPSAMAHAAHYNHTDIMGLLLSKPMDLKATMQAISGGASPQMASIIITAMKMSEAANAKENEKRQTRHDFKAEFVQIAAAKGNTEVLKQLLAEYDIPWTAAQSLVKSAAENGNREVFDLIMSAGSIQEDQEELEEAVGAALKVAAETGSEAIADYLIEKHPSETKQHCKPVIFRAYKYGHFGVADALTEELCTIDKAGPKLKEAEWLGKLAVAAREGDAAAVKELLKTPDAGKLIAKLQYRLTDPKSGKKGPLMAPHPINDPLVSAAKGCHAEVVQLLADKHVLCAACAAAEAARKGCSKITMDLAMGHGKAMMQAMMQDDGDTIDPALRVVAYSMEEGNWELVAWMIAHHASAELGPYFLPAIAQEGKVDDLAKMLDVLKKAGYDKTQYFKDQVHSAKITAALGGNVELLLKLEEHAAPLSDEEKAADMRRKGGPEGGPGRDEL
ncbi:hypothetical protein OEZ85_006634 [Tetradesmus obliquus]|uniref:Ankyrin repeat domain-containing protein n=1 Tax=Tetradesmus obliquus TaxID=3088 RepID=A0ABY8TVM8_TETOB|nr:hypothetical protein OEZ85_006634 [Tetradesmus obliquus]